MFWGMPIQTHAPQTGSAPLYAEPGQVTLLLVLGPALTDGQQCPMGSDKYIYICLDGELFHCCAYPLQITNGPIGPDLET